MTELLLYSRKKNKTRSKPPRWVFFLISDYTSLPVLTHLISEFIEGKACVFNLIIHKAILWLHWGFVANMGVKRTVSQFFLNLIFNLSMWALMSLFSVSSACWKLMKSWQIYTVPSLHHVTDEPWPEQSIEPLLTFQEG